MFNSILYEYTFGVRKNIIQSEFYKLLNCPLLNTPLLRLNYHILYIIKVNELKFSIDVTVLLHIKLNACVYIKFSKTFLPTSDRELINNFK